MAFYSIRFNGRDYINEELCQKVFAEGERSFIKRLARGEIVGTPLLDQILYPVNDEERDTIRARYAPQEQDFDAQYRKIHVLSQGAPAGLWNGAEPGCLDEGLPAERFSDCAITRVVVASPEDIITYRHVRFLPLRMYHPAQGYKYGRKEQVASVRIFKYWYLALDAVDITMEKPVVVTAS